MTLNGDLIYKKKKQSNPTWVHIKKKLPSKPNNWLNQELSEFFMIADN